MFVCFFIVCCYGNDYKMVNFNINFKVFERDGENGWDRNVFLVEYIFLIIGKSIVEGEFRVIRDTLMFNMC